MGRKNKKNNFVPYEKQSRKEKKKIDSQKRGQWELDPVTKVIPDKRRKKIKDNYYREDME